MFHLLEKLRRREAKVVLAGNINLLDHMSADTSTLKSLAPPLPPRSEEQPSITGTYALVSGLLDKAIAINKQSRKSAQRIQTAIGVVPSPRKKDKR